MYGRITGKLQELLATVCKKDSLKAIMESEGFAAVGRGGKLAKK